MLGPGYGPPAAARGERKKFLPELPQCVCQVMPDGERKGKRKKERIEAINSNKR